MIVIAALAGPAVLLIVQHTVHTAIRLRPIEAIAVGAAAGSLVGLIMTLPPQRTILLLPLAVLGCAAAVVDAHEGRLPDVLTWPLLLATLLAGIVTAEGNGTAVTAVSMLTGGCVAVVFKTVVSAGFGWGDAKLLPTLAVVLARHDEVVIGIVAVAVLVAVTALLIARWTADRSALVPYGPAMVVGTVGVAAL